MHSLNFSTFHTFLSGNSKVVLYAAPFTWNDFNPFVAEHFGQTRAVPTARLDLSTGVDWFSKVTMKALKQPHGAWDSAYYLAVGGKIVRCHHEDSADTWVMLAQGALTGDMQSARRATQHRAAAKLIAEFEEILTRISPPPTKVRKAEPDPYAVLGIHPGATAEEIDSARRKKTYENHPDRVATMSAEIKSFAEARTVEINAAWAQLRQRKQG